MTQKRKVCFGPDYILHCGLLRDEDGFVVEFFNKHTVIDTHLIINNQSVHDWPQHRSVLEIIDFLIFYGGLWLWLTSPPLRIWRLNLVSPQGLQERSFAGRASSSRTYKKNLNIRIFYSFSHLSCSNSPWYAWWGFQFFWQSRPWSSKTTARKSSQIIKIHILILEYSYLTVCLSDRHKNASTANTLSTG